MRATGALGALALAACATVPCAASDEPHSALRTSSEIVVAAPPSDWRPLDPENTLYLELASGRVVFELAPAFAPQHVANVKALARERYFDGLAVLRSQDNYVMQWGDPDGEDESKRRPVGKALRALPAEFCGIL